MLDNDNQVLKQKGVPFFIEKLNLTLTFHSNTIINFLEKKLTLQSTDAQKSETASLDKALAELQKDIAELSKHSKVLAEEKRKQEQDVLQLQVEQGIQQLETIAGYINDLAAQLASEMMKFKEIAGEVNQCYHLIQQPPDFKLMGWNESRQYCWRPGNILEVHYWAVPTLVRRGAKFILTAKIVDMFKVEREVDAQRRAKSAQQRREALERWLTEQRKKVL